MTKINKSMVQGTVSKGDANNNSKNNVGTKLGKKVVTHIISSLIFEESYENAKNALNKNNSISDTACAKDDVLERLMTLFNMTLVERKDYLDNLYNNTQMFELLGAPQDYYKKRYFVLLKAVALSFGDKLKNCEVVETMGSGYDNIQISNGSVQKAVWGSYWLEKDIIDTLETLLSMPLEQREGYFAKLQLMQYPVDKQISSSNKFYYRDKYFSLLRMVAFSFMDSTK